MAEKKYYWLKMEGDFFNQKEIRKLRRIAGGDTYVIIYLKMSLLSLKDDGKLYYEGVEESFIEELAYELHESVENVEITVSFLKAHSMLEQHNSDEFYMNRIPEMTGGETDSARRKRKERLRKKENVTLICDNVQKSHTIREREEIETKEDIDKELDNKKPVSKKPTKHKYGEYKNVLLTDKQYSKLLDDWGQEKLDFMMTKLDEGIQLKAYKYKDHNLAIRQWEKNTRFVSQDVSNEVEEIDYNNLGGVF